MTDPQRSSGAMPVLGTIIVIIAILWLALSGLCTAGGLLIGVSLLFSPYGDTNASVVGMALLIGAPAIGVGLLALWLGRKIERSGKSPEKSPQPGA